MFVFVLHGIEKRRSITYNSPKKKRKGRGKEEKKEGRKGEEGEEEIGRRRREETCYYTEKYDFIIIREIHIHQKENKNTIYNITN